MERILVLGATGWFGRTFLSLVPPEQSKSLLLVAGAERQFSVAGREWTAREWSDEVVSAWAPEAVLNFAFLTKERLADLGHDVFVRRNEVILRNLEFALGLSSVEAVLSCATGASLETCERMANPYGYLKWQEEELVRSFAVQGRVSVMPRVYSVSGAFVTRPHRYALSSFVLQARRGSVLVESDRPTFRSYSSVRDVVDVSMRLLKGRQSAEFESGGERIEMRDLAHRVVNLVNPSAQIKLTPWAFTKPSEYVSPTKLWNSTCVQVGVRPLSLNEQIVEMAKEIEQVDEYGV